jgi:hypothetical protein
MMDTGRRRKRKPSGARSIAWKSRQRRWCLRIRGEHSADMWRECIARKAGVEEGLRSMLVVRLLGLHHEPRHTCSPVIVTW